MQLRPNPEKLLKRVQEEERQKEHGKLKIYLGAAPGVGKTYTMLQDALAKRAQGLDVVAGVVESHGREEIVSLLNKLEILPRHLIDYHGKQLEEFNLDAALKRNPGLILIDEMAHTNAPFARHAKRWLDIKEILDRGIDVYTTLNVQHIESRNDLVAQVIHTKVKETVPDSMLDLADTIELIDLPPEDLLKRLQEGKVYIPEQAALAKEHFFRKGNLIALREIALRVTAEHVGTQVLLYRQGQGIKHVWPTTEKILVCVGPGTESIKLIRTAKRMAVNLQSDWIAVYVEAMQNRFSEEQRNSAIYNLRLAEQLGADTQILNGFDTVNEILNFAREQNITQIVIGKRIRSRWKEFFSASLTDEIVRHSGEIDVHIITGFTEKTKPLKKIFSVLNPFSWKTYIISVAIVALVAFFNYLLFPYISTSDTMKLYLLSVTLVMLLVAFIISHLIILTRRQAEISRLVAQRTSALHTLSRKLASTRGVDKLLEVAVPYIAKIFDSEVLALLPKKGQLVIHTRYKTDMVLNEKEQSVAQWVFDLGQIAGLGTDTLPFSDAIYVPLFTSQDVMGVLRIRPTQPTRLFTPEQIHLLEAFANQIALALEVDRRQEQVKKSELRSETDRAKNALLEAVSHDLRTPLLMVMGAASTLVEMSGELDKIEIKKLGKTIYLELEQLSRLINNLLQITYLEGEKVKLQKKLHSLEEVINLVIKTSKEKLAKRTVNIQIPKDLPKIPFDNTLIQEVFINLIDNAIKFTPSESPIDIAVVTEKGRVRVSVSDRGPGIVADEVTHLFEKFYRGRMLTSERGLGLGLAICHRIIKVHGGEIWAENRGKGGAVFCFTLPMD